MSFNPSVSGIGGATDVALNSKLNNQVLTYDSAVDKWRNKTATGGSGDQQAGIMVFSQEVAAAAGYTASTPTIYVCTGTNDQITINAALRVASSSDGMSFGNVQLSGGVFSISAPIFMYPGTTLAGSGQLTILKSVAMTGARAVVELLNVDTQLTTVRDLTIDGNFVAGGNSHALFYTNVGGNLGRYDPGNSPDSSHQIMNLFITNFSGSSIRNGIYLGENSRDTKVLSCRIRNCSGSGVKIESASDGKYIGIICIGSGQHGFDVGGASSLFVNCKAAYSEIDGWNVSSSRTSMNGCEGQDNGRHGLNVTGVDSKIASFRADSNRRLDTSGAGVVINSSRVMVTELMANDRAQSPQRQTVGVAFVNSPSDIRISGSIRLPDGDTTGTYVTGTYNNSSNYISISRVGSSILSI